MAAAKALKYVLAPYSDDDEPTIRLPIPPSSYQISYPQNSTQLNVNEKGTINALGKRGLRTVSLSVTLPAQDYSWLVYPREYAPYEYAEILEGWKNDNLKLHFKVIGGVGAADVNFLCTITGLTYGESDSSGDVSCTIELTEYRTIGTTRAKKSSSNKSKNYTTKKALKTTVNGSKVTVKKGETVNSIAKKKLGSSKYGPKIYTKNKKTIEAAFKKWKKSENKKLAKKRGKPQIKVKNSHKGQYLPKGTKLVMPKVSKK